MQTFLIWASAGFGAGIILASFFEWTLHRFVMHKAVGKFDYAFRAHAVVHHGTFRSDRTYHLVDEKIQDKNLIPMAWWNGPVLIVCCMVPATLLAWWLGSWQFAVGALPAFIAYYGTYEYIHWCMHLPKARKLEKSWPFYRLNGHHLLHHRYMHKNFNVVLPLADFLLGTLILRSKIKFPQPIHEAVPDVQPRESHRRPSLEVP